MSYENAKATGLIATHCVCCGRPLLDAESVELGIGPVCREKHGYNEGITGDARRKANALVHEAAAVQGTNAGRVVEIAVEIGKLGLGKLSGIILARFVEIHVTAARAHRFDWDGAKRKEVDSGVEIDVLQVRTPYHPTFSQELRTQLAGAYRRPVYDGQNPHTGKPKFSHWEVEASSARKLLGVLATCFPGRPAIGTKGPFNVPTRSEYDRTMAAPRPVTRAAVAAK